MTLEDISAAAQRYFTEDRYVRVVLEREEVQVPGWQGRKGATAGARRPPEPLASAAPTIPALRPRLACSGRVRPVPARTRPEGA